MKAHRNYPDHCPRTDALTILRDDAMYREVESDEPLADQFRRYWTWLHGLQTPDVVYIASLPALDLERATMLFHEKVELRGWLRLGHEFADIMTEAYYEQHYAKVYPVAHANAIVAELELLQRVGERVGVDQIPLRAFVLVSPLVERRGVTPAKADRRLTFNRKIAEQRLTRADLESATYVYELGGYAYRNRSGLVDQAIAIAQTSP